MHTVAIVAYDGAPSFELAIPAEVFGLDLLASRYQALTVAGTSGPIRTSGGWRVATDAGLEALRTADTIVMPGWRDELNDAPARLVSALKEAYGRGARVMSLCTGAFVLAQAGLLDGRRATTHWRHADELSRRHPLVAVDPRVLYIDEGRVLTSAGTAAGIDLLLHVVRHDLGAMVANAVGRRLVVAPHRAGGQSQFVERLIPAASEATIAETCHWLEEHLHEPLSLADAAKRHHWSVRHFVRRFASATGTTPHAWLIERRLVAAQELLEGSDEPIEIVAQRTGFGSAQALRMHFRRRYATSPSVYRATFRGAVR